MNKGAKGNLNEYDDKNLIGKKQRLSSLDLSAIQDRSMDTINQNFEDHQN